MIEEEPTPEPVDEDLPLDEMKECDLVWLSDSSGGAAAYLLKGYIEEDTGKKVNLYDYTIDGMSAGVVLAALRGEIEDAPVEKLNILQERVADAEMIVFFANPGGLPGMDDLEGDIGACVNFRTGNPPDNCSPEVYQPYQEG